jgi:tetratricopeptide (TPR) repeat protein
LPTSPADPVEREAIALKQAIEANPTRPGPYLDLAQLYRQAGRFEQAHQALASGLGPTGHAFDLSVALAEVAIEPLRRDLAIANDKLAGSPADAELAETRSALSREVLRREVDLYRLQSDRYPGQARFRYALGARLLMLGQIEEAMRELQQACGDEQLRWRALAALGHCWRAWDNVSRALKHFEDALAAAPPDDRGRLDLLYEVACCHADLGAMERAVERGSELAEQAPGHRDIMQLLPAWQSRSQ